MESVDDANAYAQWAGKGRARLEEKAAPWGSTSGVWLTAVKAAAWETRRMGEGNVQIGIQPRRAEPVRASAYGGNDMGAVAEWVCPQPYALSATDKPDESLRVTRRQLQ